MKETFLTIKSKDAITERLPAMTEPVRAMSPRAAIFSVGRERNIRECDGKVLAAATVSCPPAIPIVVCGEVIDKDAIRVMEYYGVKNCRVVEE